MSEMFNQVSPFFSLLSLGAALGAAFVAVKETLGQYYARRQLERILLKTNLELRAFRKDRNRASPKNSPSNSITDEEIEAMLSRVLRKLSEDERRRVSEAMNQPSELGRRRYLRSIYKSSELISGNSDNLRKTSTEIQKNRE